MTSSTILTARLSLCYFRRADAAGTRLGRSGRKPPQLNFFFIKINNDEIVKRFFSICFSETYINGILGFETNDRQQIGGGAHGSDR